MNDFAKKLGILIFCLLTKPEYSQKISFELQTAPTSGISSIWFTPDSEFLFSTSTGGQSICVWQTSSGKKIKTIPITENFHKDLALFFDPLVRDSNNIIFPGNQTINPENATTKFFRTGDTTYSLNVYKKKYNIYTQKQIIKQNVFVSYVNKKGETVKKPLYDQGPYKKYTNLILDGNRLITSTTKGDVIITDLKGNLLSSFKFGNAPIISLCLSKDKQLLAIGNAQGELRVINIKEEKIVSECKGINQSISKIYYSKDGNTLFIVKSDGLYTFNFTDNSTKRLNIGTRMKDLSIDNIIGDSICILSYLNAAKPFAKALGYDGTSKFTATWNINNNTFENKEVAFLGSSGGTFSNSAIQSVDVCGKFRVSTSSGQVFTIYNDSLGSRDILTDHSAPISAIKINKVYNYVTTASCDGTLKHWDLITGKQLFTSIIINLSSYIHILPEGYYYGTKRIFNSLNCVKGTSILPGFQMDEQYNRPDLVIKQIPQHDPILAAAIDYSYKRREKKKVKITDQSDVFLSVKKLSQDKGSITYNIKVNSSASVLTKLNFFVNGVNENLLIEEQKGTIELNHTVDLANGQNKIEVYAQDNTGAFSNQITLSETNQNKLKPDLYLICIGSSKFIESDKNLNYAAKDARDVSALLGKSGGAYNKINSFLFVDKQVNEEITSEIEKLILNARKNDVVIVFYAGHGILDRNLNYYLSTYDVDFSNPEKKGIAYEKIEKILQKCSSRQKLFFIDACHSGDIEKESLKQTAVTKDSTTSVVFRSGSQNKLSQNELSLLLSKELFASAGNYSGTSVIGASMGSQYALESNSWGNGVFTHALLLGIGDKKADYNGDGKVMLDELQFYVNKKVDELTGGKQKPTTRAENLIGNLRIK